MLARGNIMNSAKFYANLRQRNSGVFGTSLSERQVQGVEAILDACEAAGTSLPETAYILATPYGETGGRMVPVRENLNYSAAQIAKHFGAHRRQGLSPQQLARNPVLLGNTVYGGEWGRVNLGNTQPGDGYNFRGFGIGQWTGRRNTAKASAAVGLDLIGKPELLDDVAVNARLLVDWMVNGRATGRKLGQYVTDTRKDYHSARAVWGGVDAAKYATYAKAFEAALQAGGWDAQPAFVDHTPPKATQSPLAALFAAIAALFKGWNK